MLDCGPRGVTDVEAEQLAQFVVRQVLMQAVRAQQQAIPGGGRTTSRRSSSSLLRSDCSLDAERASIVAGTEASPAASTVVLFSRS